MLARAQRADAPEVAQRQTGRETTVAGRTAVTEVLRSPGHPLPAGLRSEMEQRLGSDFSDVRVHTGPRAERSADEISARAYTSGSHVVIGAGGADKHTLAHELTHVIQQRQGPVSGVQNSEGLRVSDPSDRYEREAERNAKRVMSLAVPPTSAATSPDHGHTLAGHRHRQNAGARLVQRMAGPGAGATTTGVDASTIIEGIKRQGEVLERWHPDYDVAFASLAGELPSGFTADARGDLLAQAQQMLTAHSIANPQHTPGQGLPARIVEYVLVQEDADSPPGIGGFNTLSMKGSEITGRPNFAKATTLALPIRPGMHRRHIIAWHNISSLLNRAYATHPSPLIDYLTAKLDTSQVAADLTSESDKAIGNMPAASFGQAPPDVPQHEQRAEAEVLLRAAYVMNSSVKNLWVGSGKENSEINQLSRTLQGKLTDLTPERLAIWEKELSNSTPKTPMAQQATTLVLHRLRGIQGNPPTDQDVDDVKYYVWNEVIRHLETDASQDASPSAGNQQAVVVGDAVFDAVFDPSNNPSFDVVRQAIDFLWTGPRPTGA
ncbi:DUF4157 domain-containing protein [Streptomyces sp. 71268]|nr:DUF4157 domain-containing protein [Streptomyces sp. 71268]WEV29778.1 DUF4157 domain-containing protein [Streptomyces sp. 71268]